MRRPPRSSAPNECWGDLSEILSPSLRRRLVLFGDAEQSVWVAGGSDDERRLVVRWLHDNGRTHLGRLLEIDAEQMGESAEDFLALQAILWGPSESGSDVTAVCIHDADRLTAGCRRLVLGALDTIESAPCGLGAPRLLATSSISPDTADDDVDEETQNLLLRLDVLHVELPDPLDELGDRTDAPTVPAATRPRLARCASSSSNSRPLGQS